MNKEELIKLADILDARGEHEAASKIDTYLRSQAADEPGGDIEPPQEYEDDDTDVVHADPTMSGTIPGAEGEQETMTMEPQEEAHDVSEDSLRGALDKFLESPRRFENVHQLKQMIDNYVLKAVPKEAGIQDVFQKLAGIADELDSEGLGDAANLIDGFLDKYAAEPVDVGGTGLLMDPEEYQAGQEELPESQPVSEDDERLLQSTQDEFRMIMERIHELTAKFFENPSDKALMQELQRSIDDYRREVEQYAELYHDIHGGAGPVVASTNSSISKRADDVVDWKEEDDTEQSKRYDDRHHHNLQVREPKRDQERVDREGRKEHHVSTQKPVEATALSSRYCPDHIGTQMGRVGPGSYQCPLDGQVYNWETGWTDFDGNQHPGGSVAAQTPDSTGYAIPHRVFDSRDKALNVVN